MIAENAKIDNGDSDHKDEIVKRLLFQNLNKAIGYLTPNANKAYIQLKKNFIKALIFQYFDLQSHIWIKIDVSSYAVGKTLSQLTLNNLCPLCLVAYFSQKIILAKT